MLLDTVSPARMLQVLICVAPLRGLAGCELRVKLLNCLIFAYNTLAIGI